MLRRVGDFLRFSLQGLWRGFNSCKHNVRPRTPTLTNWGDGHVMVRADPPFAVLFHQDEKQL